MHFLKNYLLLSAVVFILMVPIFLEAFRTIENNVEERTYREIVRGVNLIDDEISSISNAIFRLRSNGDYSYVRSTKAIEKTSDYYVIYELRNYFADITGFYTFFKSPLCYFPNGIVITPETVYVDSEREGSLLYHPVGYDSQKMWLEDLSKENYSYEFLSADTFCNATGTMVGLPYAHTYASVRNRENAMFLAILPIDRIYELTGLDDLKEIASIMIINHNTNEVLYSNQVEIQKNSSVFEVRSNQSLISIVVEIPKSYFWRQMDGMFGIIIIYLFLFLVVAFIISILLAWRNIKPIKKIISVLDDYTDSPNMEKLPDYEYIERSITEIAESRIQNQNRYKKLNEEMDHWLFREQILNGLEGDRLHEFLVKHTDFQTPFRLLVLQMTHTEWEIPSEDIKLLFEQQKIELFFFSKVRPNLFIMIRQEDCDDEDLQEIFHRFITQAEHDFDCDVILAVSESLQSLEKLNEVYHVERYSMKYLSSQKLILQEKVDKKIKGGLSDIDLLENVKLTDLILAGNEQEAVELISRQWYQVSISQTYTMIEQLFYMQAALLNNIAVKLRSEIRVDEMEYSDNIPDMEQKMLNCVKELCAISVKIKNDSKNELPKRIVLYIEEHFDDPDFYMTSLVEAFGMSDKTIVRLIKSYLNIGFSEYLEQLRIQKARILLENPKLSIRAIAYESGFSSENTFYKAFRRIYKVSPSDYRANLQHLKEKSDV